MAMTSLVSPAKHLIRGLTPQACYRHIQATMMRSKALQSAASLLKQQAYSSGFRSLSTSSHAAFPLVSSQENDKEAQQPALPASLPTMLLPNKKQGLLGAFQQQQVRTMAGGPPVTNTTSENTWAIFRTKYAYERRSDLSAAMYALILAFGLGPLVADAYAYPSRILFMTSLVFYVLYTRRM